MIPDSSPHYTYATKITTAYLHREAGSYAIGHEPTPETPVPLKIAYRRYEATNAIPPAATAINLVLFHGTGMNKGLWHYHIDQLYRRFSSSATIRINTVLAMDAINHGDSAVANRGRLGSRYDWRDGGYDIVKVVTKDEASSFLSSHQRHINVLVGHSFGGCTVMFAASFGLEVFDCCIPINPVCYFAPEERFVRQKAMTDWWYKGYLNSRVAVATAQDYWLVVLKKYQKNVFYARFHPLVLSNFVEDEIPPEVGSLADGDTLELKTSTEVQRLLYSYSDFNDANGQAALANIKIPVFLIYGENDLADAKNRNHTREVLKQSCRYIEIPKGGHVLHAEEPDLTVHLLGLIIEERCIIRSRL
ncbi:alpha/beta-hydrolase [Suhomyces tanzawaensis NRRL Y-17324]|uniref:Alpha/beta-hydrolase n=1 Tax=Suhomyces tanzawaensis NRRL Y-17324 TaxID=984487 RepID=A0A1E4SB66_9ASCO|nr:alpha/beta-hydrolase [Suhomyces tanzawaensis NRRL Y-17324]ODV76770.1 alpha/beta-hydrolase [Suhomyces tanzawaensis NRRL Y-17324]